MTTTTWSRLYDAHVDEIAPRLSSFSRRILLTLFRLPGPISSGAAPPPHCRGAAPPAGREQQRRPHQLRTKVDHSFPKPSSAHGMTRRRRLPSPAPPPPLEDDDLVAEILRRLPPLPSSLPRASLVCGRWRRLVSDPGFLRGFRAHHRKAPLLGIFHEDTDAEDADSISIRFTSALESPDRIPASRFPVPVENPDSCYIIGSRHGRVLFIHRSRWRYLMWEPLTGGQQFVPFPPAFDCVTNHVSGGAIVCAASDESHVHGACHSAPFQVILLGCNRELVFACIYSSETGEWGNLNSIPWPLNTGSVSSFAEWSSILVGNSICWMLMGSKAAIISFDLDRQNLDVVQVPPDVYDPIALFSLDHNYLITPTDDGGLGLLFVSACDYNIRLWKRKTDCYGVAGWVLQNTVELNNHLLSLRPEVVDNDMPLLVMGLAEEDSLIFLLAYGAIFMVHVESAQFKKFPQSMHYCRCHPFTSFYTAG
ncbi:hypothetical protein ACP70R_019789 [Stipagrostis hirtigluma subsp. patula]